jgi:hypothetical protein
MSRDIDVDDSFFFVAVNHIKHLSGLLESVRKTVANYDVQLKQIQDDIEQLEQDNATDIRHLRGKKETLVQTLNDELISYIYNRSEFKSKMVSVLHSDRFYLPPESLSSFPQARRELMGLVARRYQEYVSDRPEQLVRTVKAWISDGLRNYIKAALDTEYPLLPVSFLTRDKKKIQSQFLQITRSGRTNQDKALDLFALMQDYLPDLAFFSEADKKYIEQELLSTSNLDVKLRNVMYVYRAKRNGCVAQNYVSDLFEKSSAGVDTLEQRCNDMGALMKGWKLSRGPKKHIRVFMKYFFSFNLDNCEIDALLAGLKEVAKKRGRMSWSQRFSTIMRNKIDFLKVEVASQRFVLGSEKKMSRAFKQCIDFMTHNSFLGLPGELRGFLMEQLRVIQQGDYIDSSQEKLFLDFLSFDNQALVLKKGCYYSYGRVEEVSKYLKQLQCGSALPQEWVNCLLDLKSYCLRNSSSKKDSILRTLPASMGDVLVACPSSSDEVSVIDMLGRIEERREKIKNKKEEMKRVQEKITCSRVEECLLKKLLAQQVFIALGHYVSSQRSRSWFSCHGKSGQRAAEDLCRAIITAETFDDARTKLMVFLQHKPQIRNHSFATYLLRELWASDSGVLGYFTKSSEYFKKVKKKNLITDIKGHCSLYLKDSDFDSDVEGLLGYQSLSVSNARILVKKRCQKQVDYGVLGKKSGSFTNWLGRFGCYSRQRKLRRKASHGVIRVLDNISSLPQQSVG